jgi:signal transduction histidine kinase
VPRTATTEQARLSALRDYDVLDTPAEEAFDDITVLCADLLDVPIALVSLIDDDRQWFKSRVGLSVSETARSIAFCHHAIEESEPFVVEDATSDPRFCDNPLVTGDPNIRFYAGVQLRSVDGHALGTLCAIDRRPRSPSSEQIGHLRRLARQVETQLELRRRLRLVEAGLARAHEQQQAKELLAAMLVHDLRSPVGGILLAAAMCEGAPASELRANIADIETLAGEAQTMLSDVLDICLADTGVLQPRCMTFALGEPVDAALRAVRQKATVKGVAFEVLGDRGSARGDVDLIRRALTNLLDNAIRYTPSGSTVQIRSALGPDSARFEVADEGRGVAENECEHIFTPHVQGRETHGARGLGLAFCRVAAEAHGGTIVHRANEPCGSRFVLTIPLEPAAR